MKKMNNKLYTSRTYGDHEVDDEEFARRPPAVPSARYGERNDDKDDEGPYEMHFATSSEHVVASRTVVKNEADVKRGSKKRTTRRDHHHAATAAFSIAAQETPLPPQDPQEAVSAPPGQSRASPEQVDWAVAGEFPTRDVTPGAVAVAGVGGVVEQSNRTIVIGDGSADEPHVQSASQPQQPEEPALASAWLVEEEENRQDASWWTIDLKNRRTICVLIIVLLGIVALAVGISVAITSTNNGNDGGGSGTGGTAESSLRVVGSSDVPLAACQGACNSDADCQSGLKCYQREAFEAVPGCTGTGISGTDYCYQPITTQEPTTPPVSSIPSTPRPTLVSTPPPTSASTPSPSVASTLESTLQPTPEPSLPPTPRPTVSTPMPTVFTPASWVQVGGDLNGESFSGSSLSLSGDGTTVAIGNKGEGSTRGRVTSFQLVDNVAWTSLAQNIVGLEPGNECCRSVSLSEDGTVVAFGSPRSNSTASHVSVYRLEGNTWRPFGTRISGLLSTGFRSLQQSEGELFGWSVSLSSNGTVLAVGAPLHETSMILGQVRVYRYVNEDWEQFGQVLDDGGTYQYSEFGRSVSLSGDGMVLAVGAPEYDSPFDHIGQVQIFAYEGTGWRSLISEGIFGETRLERSGTSVALSRDGKTVAIGAPLNEANVGRDADFGSVRVFRRFSNQWSQVGQDIDGKVFGGKLGTSVGLSSDGNAVVVGSPGNGTGYAQVYKLDEGIWTQIGDDLEGEYEGDAFGTSVSLSSNADMVAVGAPMNQEGRGTPGGHARLFRLR